jgi:putative ABC transport system permease protein
VNLKKINYDKYRLNLKIAYEAVLGNKTRAILTALGIIFGVAAVISMLAIGNGAKKELLDQMKLVGVNNIIITPRLEADKSSSDEEEEETDEKSAKSNLSSGLTLADAEAIFRILPTVNAVSPEVHSDESIIYKKKSVTGQFTGVDQHFFEIYNLLLSDGKYFNEHQHKTGAQVCIIGYNVAVKLFPTENPIGKYVKCGSLWLKVVGVLESRLTEESQRTSLQIDNFNYNVYTPLQTVLLRHNDRSAITSSSFNRGRRRNSGSNETVNRNQLDKLIIQIDKSENLNNSVDVIHRILKRRHADIQDFNITVPELQLKQEQKTREIFNIVLAAIASISLIVGGIGIMNIMLASVLERVREIGLRRAIGARKEDVILQFIAEATIISVTGGVLGVILGVVIAQLISQFTDITTIISGFSIFISFMVSVGVGLIFGYMPAKKAALQDPVTSLRHE